MKGGVVLVLVGVLLLSSCQAPRESDRDLSSGEVASAGIASQAPSPEEGDVQKTRNITSKQLLEIQSGMTFQEIFERLGTTSSLGLSNFAQYQVDNRLLLLRYDSLDEKCGLSGKDLLAQCRDLRTDLNNPKERTFTAIIVTDPDQKMVVTCPGYTPFDSASLTIPEGAALIDSNQTPVSLADLTFGTEIQVHYEEPVLTSNPPIVTAQRIMKLD